MTTTKNDLLGHIEQLAAENRRIRAERDEYRRIALAAAPDTTPGTEPQPALIAFLRRCVTIYRKGLARPEVFAELDQYAFAGLRMMHYWTQVQSEISTGKAPDNEARYQRQDAERTFSQIARYRTVPASNAGTGYWHTLANDPVGYGAVNVAAILNHHCQICAEDVNAWHTRAGFCPHNQNDEPSEFSHVTASPPHEDP